MDDSLQRAIDDELATDRFSTDRSHELADARALFDGVLRAIPERPLPELGASVLQRIEAVERASAPLQVVQSERKRSSGASWLWSPHSVSIRPAYALAAAAVLAIAIGVSRFDGDSRHLTAAPAVAASSEVLVHFRLEAPQAKTVMLTGDFSNWSATHQMMRSSDGVWTIVVPLAPGVHQYSFIVDGNKWVPDPAAPPMPDGFGGMNSRVAVLAPDART